MVLPVMRRWQIEQYSRDRSLYRRPGRRVGISGSRTLPCRRPIRWAASQVAMSTKAACVGWADQIHSLAGIHILLPALKRRRPITWWPVYLGFDRISSTRARDQPAAGGG
jgi:hypothetical protein